MGARQTLSVSVGSGQGQGGLNNTHLFVNSSEGRGKVLVGSVSSKTFLLGSCDGRVRFSSS